MTGTMTQKPSLLRSYIQALEGKLEGQEADVYRVLQEERPEWTKHFATAVPKARLGILSRLINAMLRENLFDFAKRQIRVRENEFHGDDVTEEQRTLAGDVLEVLRTQGIEMNDAQWRLIPLTSDMDQDQDNEHGENTHVLAIPVTREFGFGRLQLAGRPVYVRRQAGQSQVRVMEHPAELLRLWHQEAVKRDELASDVFDRFADEVCNSTANLVLAYCAGQVREEELRAEAGDAKTLLDYIAQKQAQDETFSPLAFLESWVLEGHPVHPGTKMKVGLPTADLLNLAPEFAARPELRFLAVHKSIIRATSIDELDANERLFLEHPEVASESETLLRDKGLSPSDFYILPIHPWQLQHSLPNFYAEELNAGLILPLNISIPTIATLSFRTLAPIGVGLSHVKTAVNVIATSTVRTISPNSAYNGPTMGRVLREIEQREGGFGERFRFVYETAGYAYRFTEDGVVRQESLSEEQQEQKLRNISILLRENPEADLHEGEIAVGASSLTMESPLSKVPFAVELIRQMQSALGIADEVQSAVKWITEYAEMCVPAFLTMLSRYGVGLEGHQQNSVPVFASGIPARMLQRDFGGMRIGRQRLAAQGLEPKLLQGSMTLIEDEEEMRGKVFHAVFQGQIGELILTLAGFYGVDEQVFWQPVATVSRQAFAELKQDPAIAEQALADEAKLFEEKLALKALTRMRLGLPCNNRQYTFEKSVNPMRNPS